MNNKNIFLVPGTGQYVKNYGVDNGADIWLGKETIPTNTPRCFIGHSLGVNCLLNGTIDTSCTFICINPLIKKRSLVALHSLDQISSVRRHTQRKTRTRCVLARQYQKGIATTQNRHTQRTPKAPKRKCLYNQRSGRCILLHQR